MTPAPAPTPLPAPFPVTEVARIISLADHRDASTPEFTSFLGSPDPIVRARAAAALGQIGARTGASLLLNALRDSVPSVRAEAAFALGEIGDTSLVVVRALRAGLTDRDDAGAAESAAALGKLASDSARAALEQALLTNTRSAVLREALLGIWRQRATAGTIEAILPLALSQDTSLRWRAAYALSRVGGGRAVAALLDAARSSDTRTVMTALRGLRAAVVDSAGARRDAFAVLTQALAGDDPFVRINALRVLSGYGQEAVPLVVAHVDMNDNVAIAALETLGALQSPVAVQALERVAADTQRRLAFRGTALASLVRIAPERARALYPTFAQSSEWLARYYAARALGAGRWTDWHAELSRLAADADVRVATAAVESVSDLGADSLDTVYRFYLERLATPDVFVRAAALRGLTHRVTAADLPIVLDAYARAGRDREPDAAVAAIGALAALQAQGTPASRSFFARFQRSADPVVLREVESKLEGGAWGPAWPLTLEHDAAYYSGLVQRRIAAVAAGTAEPRVRIRTAVGDIVVELAGSTAPITIENLMSLADRGYFNGARWHRVVPNFVLQDGDPRGDGNGGPGYSIRDEMNRIRYDRGTIGMALSGPDTGGSQFFITHTPQPHLDGGYTAFGHVVSGMDVADSIVQDEPILAVEVIR